MLRVKSLMCETAAVVGGFYYVTKTFHLGEKEIGKGCFQFNKSKLVHAEADLPSCNLNLKDTAHVDESGRPCNGPTWDIDWDGLWPIELDQQVLQAERNPNSVKDRQLFLIADGSRNGSFLSAQGRSQGVQAGRRMRAAFRALNVNPKAKASAMRDFAQNFDRGFGDKNLGWEWQNEVYLCSGTPYRSNPPRTGDVAVSKHRILRDHAMLEAAYRRIFYRPHGTYPRATNEVFACKRNTIKFFIVRSLQLPLIAWDRFTIIPGSITHIIIDEVGRVICNNISSIGHYDSREDCGSGDGGSDRPRPPDTGRPNQCEPPKRPSCSTLPDDPKKPRPSTGESSEPGSSGGGRCAERPAERKCAERRCAERRCGGGHCGGE